MQSRNVPDYPNNPFVVKMEIPAPQDSAGSLIVADLNNDGRMDYLVTVPGHVAAYAWDGRKLWGLKTDGLAGYPMGGGG
ncbi:MAG: hypothetical protein ACP5RN_02475 [Armatimonadota bacterium]